MDLAGRIAELIRPTVEHLGYQLVRVQLHGRQRMRLQIMAERNDGVPMLVDDCAELSRALSAVLDVEDPIAGTYTLEVSSPGIDRPLVTIADYDRFAGHQARVELRRLVNGRRRLVGELRGSVGDDIRLRIDSGEMTIPFDDILRAKLILTDELLATAHRAE